MNTTLDAMRETLEGGGFVALPLLILAGLLWYALAARFVALRRGTALSLQRAVAAGVRGGVLGAAIGLGEQVRRRYAAGARGRQVVLESAMFGVQRELRRHGALVRGIVIVAPLLGLLGTVSGMIETFEGLGQMALYSQSGGVAGGIAEALLSTQLGLAVAIPGLVVGRLLDRRQHALEAELDAITEIYSAASAEEAP